MHRPGAKLGPIALLVAFVATVVTGAWLRRHGALGAGTGTIDDDEDTV